MRWGAKASVGLTIAATTLVVIVSVFLERYELDDDAYITFRYAENFARGMGLVWNAGERVEGYSNFLWVVVCAVASYMGADLPTFAKCASVLLFVALAVRLFLFCSRDLHLSLASSGLVILLLDASYFHWVMGGLENSLYVFLIAEANIRLLKGQLSLAGFIYFLVAITRPEGILHVAPALLVLSHASRGRGLDLRRLWPLLVPYAVPLAFFLMFRLGYYGELLPNTYFAKVHSPLGHRVQLGLWYSLTYLMENHRWLVFVFAFGSVLTLRSAGVREPTMDGRTDGKADAADYSEIRSRALALFFASIAVSGAYVLVVGSDFKPAFRFFMPIVPAVVVLTSISLSEVASRIRGRVPASLLSGAFIALNLILWVSAQRQSSDRQPVVFDTRTVKDRVHSAFVDHPTYFGRVGAWVEMNIGSDQLIALDQCGSIPYATSDHRYLDVLGLMDKEIARITRQRPFYYQKYIDYFRQRDPGYVLLFFGKDPYSETLLPWLVESRYFRRNYVASAILESESSRLNFMVFKKQDVRPAERVLAPPNFDSWRRRFLRDHPSKKIRL